MRFAILGTLAVTHEGQSLPISGPIARRLLAALLVNPNQVVPDQWLADQVWGDTDDDGWKNRLETAVSRLGSRLSVTSGRRIVREGVGYRLVVGPGELDADVFERLRREAAKALASGEPEDAVELAERALAEWRGRAFGELAPEPFAYPRARALDANRLIAQQARMEGLLQVGRHAEVVPDAEALVATEPGNEQLLGLLATALYRSGRPDDALDACRAYRAHLTELGRQPGTDLAKLERAVLDHDPSLDWSPAAGDPGAPGGAGGAGGTQTAGLRTFLLSGWDKEPDPATGEAQEAMVAAAITAHGGHVFGRAGLGLSAVFERPADAVLAASDAARTVQRATAQTPGGLRVRLAVHTGEASRRDESFAGPAVTRVARMRDAGHGGQVLVSAATRELVADELPPDVQLVSIGAWQFDGFRHPERLYQLTHVGLNAEFPPLRAGLRHTGQLPRYTTPFLGREHEVTDAANRLRRHPVVTLTGDGGIGKTRLALELAQRATAADYPDGVWYCDVSLASDAGSLVERAAAARGLVPVAGDHRRNLLQSLESARLLFVLDGCERLRESVAKLMDELLESGTEARLLVTSRARLGLPAEQVIKLDPLHVPERTDPEPEAAPAVQLLRELATRAGARVATADPHLAELARRLDGLPLAIELAAPRLVSMSAATLAERLDQSIDTLTGSPGAPARHQTLRATFHWSFDLLTAGARSLFGALSLFQGTWTLETAEAVATAVDVKPQLVETLIAELVDQSLVRVDMPAGGTARYTMLDTIRAFAADHLAEAGRYERVADLHAAHFLALAERAAPHRRGPDEAAWVGVLEAELDDLRAAYQHLVDAERPADAVRLLVALVDDLLLRERLEIGRCAADLADHPALADEPIRAEALALAANASMVAGRLHEAVDQARTALDVEKATGAPRSWIARNALALLIAVHATKGRWRDHLEAMEEISSATGDPFPAALALWNQAIVATFMRKDDRAEAPAKALLALGNLHDNPSMRSMGLLTLGRVAALRQDLDTARDLLNQARGAAEAARGTLVANLATRALADLDNSTGDRTARMATLRHIAQRFRESGNLSEQLQTVMSMVEQLVALGALVPAAIALSALERTPMAHADEYAAMTAVVTERLGPTERLAARGRGAALSLPNLVTELMRAVDAQVEGELEP